VASPCSPIQRQSLSLDITASELALAKGKGTEALQIAQTTLRAYPQSYAAGAAMINADLVLGRTNDAITWLKARTRLQPNEIVWWSLLSKVKWCVAITGVTARVQGLRKAKSA